MYPDPLTLTYAAPASVERMMFDGLPLGNGRLGGLVLGDPGVDLVNLTDCTLWTGDGNLRPAGNGPSYHNLEFGTFTQLARLTVTVDGHALGGTSGYRRVLDLSNGLATCEYAVGGASVTRVCYASHPDDVLVYDLSATAPVSGSIAMQGTHGGGQGFDAAFSEQAGTGENSVHLGGRISNGLTYAAAATVTVDSGSVAVCGGSVTFSGARRVTVIATTGTNYVADAGRGYLDQGLVTLDAVTAKLRAAAALGPDALLERHLDDYRALYNGFALDLGTTASDQKNRPTWDRLVAHHAGTPDPELEVATVQFGRYLAIASSRDSLPSTLQGLWLDTNEPAWSSDYHVDINLQMNYWLADRAGLGPTFTPLADYCVDQLPGWTRATASMFQRPENAYRNSSGQVAGWTVPISTNIWGGGGWDWGPAGNAWLCQNLMDHYWFHRDREYLARIMPVLRGAVEFWQARLVEIDDPDHPGARVLVDDMDWSPEHGPKARGITYGQELVYNLFTSFAAAARVLGTDTDLAAAATDLRGRLKLPRVNPGSGQLQEWLDPGVTGEFHHRHLSPFVGLSPGDRITVQRSELSLLRAMQAALLDRGEDSFGWGVAWRSLAWARLHDASRAYAAFRLAIRPSENFSNGLSANLFDQYSFGSSSAFQIDANFGLAAAALDLIVHSSPGSVHLLPALPDAWAARGSARGVGTRAGLIVDLEWSAGGVTSASFANPSTAALTVDVRHGGWAEQITLAAGASLTVTPLAPGAPVTLRNRATGNTLGVQGGSRDAGARLNCAPATGAAHERWVFDRAELGQLSLRSVDSGFVADVESGPTAPGAPVILWGASGSANQAWRLRPVGGGGVLIEAPQTGFVLASGAGAEVTVAPAIEGDQRQVWEIVGV
ncbi:glycoside hydrolase N-terminal domain-containing protein [Micrococcales bacterium 31B]|nr:glycoside hydrolase N-terminal domain-containing protein [Micrococcales bacterium 31B]